MSSSCKAEGAAIDTTGSTDPTEEEGGMMDAMGSTGSTCAAGATFWGRFIGIRGVLEGHVAVLCPASLQEEQGISVCLGMHHDVV